MGKMYFLPGMKPGNVSGAAGASGPRTAERLVFGSAYRGAATPKNLVPYEEKRRDVTKLQRDANSRAQDVADSFNFHRDSPASAAEKLNATRKAAESVAL